MIVIMLLILGLCVGSFINALVWRIYQQDRASHTKKSKTTTLKIKHQQLTSRNLSILHGRSMCVHCKQQLGPKDLVPLLSWLSLRGRCRYCKKSVSAQYPLVEALNAGLFALSYAQWPYSLEGLGIVQFVLWLSALTLFIALAVYDLRWMLLPNRLVAFLTVIASLHVLAVFAQEPTLRALLLVVGAVAAIAGLFYILFSVSDGRWIGGGDVKLAVPIGMLMATPSRSVLVIFISSLLGCAVTIPLLISKKTKLTAKIPYGPFLIAATIIVYVWGERLTNWYIEQFLYL